MIMTTWQGVVTVLMAVLGTIITRFSCRSCSFPSQRNRRTSSTILATCFRTP